MATEKRKPQPLNFCYTDDVMSDNSRSTEYLYLILHNKLVMKRNKSSSASYLILKLYVDDTGKLKSKLFYGKRDDFLPILMHIFCRIQVLCSKSSLYSFQLVNVIQQ